MLEEIDMTDELIALKPYHLLETLSRAVYRKDQNYSYVAGVMESVLTNMLEDLQRTNPEYAEMYKKRLINAVTKYYEV